MKEDESPLLASAGLNTKVTAYSKQHSTTLPEHITEYHARISSSRDDSYLMTSNFQSQFNVFLARSIGAKRVLEIGVYVGYSAMVWAHAVGPTGFVTGLEFDEEYTEIANEALEANGVLNVDIKVGPAKETIERLDPDEPYDLVFIDADKPNNPTYLKQLLARSAPGSSRRLLRPGALIVSDNVLRRGLVVDDGTEGGAQLSREHEEPTLALREFNHLCVSDPRLETFFMPLWDGVSITRVVD